MPSELAVRVVAATATAGPIAKANELSRYDIGAGDRWYVAMTLPRKERVASANLEKQAFRSFLPLLNVTIRHAHKFKNELTPVFSGYIFVILNTERQRWRSVNGTIGIARLITNGEKPLAVAVGVVETLVSSSDDRGALVFQRDLVVGETVRLLRGPFAESLGVFERLDGPGRVQVMLAFVGGAVRVNVPRDTVATAR